MKPKGRLIIICGLPGSGKTTLALKLESEYPAIRLCPDEWMEALSLNLWDEDRRGKIETLQWKMGRNLLAQGLTVIVEWGTWGKSERDSLREEAQALGATAELYYLSASPETLFARISKRNLEDPPIKREDVAKWFNVFQEPTADEFQLFDVVKKISEK